MSTLPLVAHAAPDSIVAWRTEGAVTRRQFLADVAHLVTCFPAGTHVLNLCTDRYRFSVGLAAAIVAGKISLLPSTTTPGVIGQIKTFAPDVFGVSDSDARAVDVPLLRYPLMGSADANPSPIPRIEARQLAAIIFTSGSTGMPQPHHKTWGALVHSVRAEAEQLNLPAGCAVVATVPPQHMFGFESTVLMPWQNSYVLSHAQPFYPADICHTLAELPAPRVLVSSPVHLRTLLHAELALPELACVVSATAPLSRQLAQDIETRWNSPLMEIFGSTETGQIASRRTTQTDHWRLFPGIRLEVEDDHVRAFGGHVETAIPLNDRIEPISERDFLLHGRIADMINIAGKRHSLASLNHVLNTIPGVVDGAFYMPDESAPGRTSRLAACVVAPELSEADLLAALQQHVDPVFLPRPLLLVASLPRNSAGKLPRAALQALMRNRGADTPHE
jgi:acyl-coenzyme A synthetase/AMP-(fatty) acid ligase